MTSFRILTAAILAASAVAISPSFAQNRGGHGMGGGGHPPSAGATVGATGAGRVSAGPAAPNVNAGANMRTSQMTAPPAVTTRGNRWNGGNWNGRVAGNTWNGNWNGRDWHRRFNGGPGFAFGFGIGPGYYDAPYYNDYAYYDDPYYSDSFAYDAGPTIGVTVNEDRDQAYCMQRYRSYDPASGTFLGYDGIRHPCP